MVAVAFCATGCAGTRVQNVERTAVDVSGRPPRTISLVVENVSPPPFKEKDRLRQLEDAQTMIADLQQGLAKKLVVQGLTIVPSGQPADLTLSCRIEELRRGHKALRMLVGFGSGAAVLRVNVTLMDWQSGVSSTLMTFDTQSTTGGMPGAGVGPASRAALVGKTLGIAAGARSGLPREADETIQTIDHQLKTYFVFRNWSD